MKTEAEKQARKRYAQSPRGKQKRREYQKRYYDTPMGKYKMREALRRWQQHIKREILAHYGDGFCACVKCGFDNVCALSLDHIEAIGAKRQGGGWVLYSRLKRMDYPGGYQTLCMNCQWVKRAKKREVRGGIIY